MDRFTRVELSPFLRPILSLNETILAIQDNVGLYEGNEKVEGYSNGKVYLTTHRLVYVDTEQPQTNSISLDLSLIKGRELFIGFLKSSPKIILKFTENNNGQASRNQIGSTSSTTWLCTICGFSINSTPSCQICGVKRPATPPPLSLLSLAENNGNNVSPPQQLVPDPDTATTTSSSDGIPCPRCTFLNHPSMFKCELCDSDLAIISIDGVNIVTEEHSVSVANSSLRSVDFIKLSFRGGGSNPFYDKLKMAMTGKEWEKVVELTSLRPASDFDPAQGGINKIRQKVEQSGKEQGESLSEAFKDLEGLIAKAYEMVKLAESINLKLNDSESPTDDASLLNNYLSDLGILSPVTKKDSGSIYHQELARQLAEFLEKILERENGMMALTDIYCIFNRARGVGALISPADLYKACSLFECLNLSMRLRKFESGLNVVQSVTHSDERTAERILEYIRANGPKTAIDLAEREKSSVFLVKEQLLMTEAKGLICRDETVEGLLFYDNLIVGYQWDVDN